MVEDGQILLRGSSGLGGIQPREGQGAAELSLACAQVPDDVGATLCERGGVRWTLVLPECLRRWFGGEGMV